MKRLLLSGCFFACIANGMQEENFFHIIPLIAGGKDAEVAQFCKSTAYNNIDGLTGCQKLEKSRILLKVLSDCSLSKTRPELHKQIKEEAEFMEICLSSIKEIARQ